MRLHICASASAWSSGNSIVTFAISLLHSAQDPACDLVQFFRRLAQPVRCPEHRVGDSFVDLVRHRLAAGENKRQHLLRDADARRHLRLTTALAVEGGGGGLDAGDTRVGLAGGHAACPENPIAGFEWTSYMPTSASGATIWMRWVPSSRKSLA